MALANGMILAIGVLLVAIPVILHFLMQPKPKPLVFPALRFITQHHRTNKRQMRLKHLLLLLLRCLLILIVAAALARPSTVSNVFGSWATVGIAILLAIVVAGLLLASIFWSERINRWLIGILSVLLFGNLIVGGVALRNALAGDQGHVIGDVQAPVAAAIIVDTSPRMAYRNENRTSLDAAKEIGDWLAGELPQDSSVSIVATDSDLPFFSVDIGAAKKRLNTLDINYVEAGIPDSIGPALRLLESAPQKRRELYIVTDMTRQSWVQSRDQQLKEKLAENRNIDIYLIDVGVEQTQNLRLENLQLAASSITQAGSIEIQTGISRRGSATQRVVNLSIEKPDDSRPVRRDGKTLVPQEHWRRTASVDIPENGTAAVRFQIGNLLPGIHHGRLELEGTDNLDVDNTQYFTISVRPAWQALVVRPSDVSEDNLVEAIASAPERDNGTAQFECTVIDQSDLSSANFDDYRVVFLLDPKPISETTWNALEAFVSNGGGLGIFLGHHAGKNGFAHPEFQSEDALRVLPGELTEVWQRTPPPENEFFRLSPDSFTHPVMADYREMASSIQWGRLPIYRHWGLQNSSIDDDVPIEVILRYDNQKPAVIQKPIGNGKVILVTTPITEPPRPKNRKPWNRLVGLSQNHWPGWLLVRQIGFFLAATQRETLNYEVGQTVSLPNDVRYQPENYRIYTPRDEDPAKVAVTQSRIRYRFTDTPGNYRLKGVFSGPVLRGFSANLDSESTRLERANSEETDNLLGVGRYQIARAKSEIGRKQGSQRMGQEFYPVLVLLLVVILVLEYLMSNFFYRGDSNISSQESFAAKMAESTS